MCPIPTALEERLESVCGYKRRFGPRRWYARTTPEGRPSSGNVRFLGLEARSTSDRRRRWARFARTGYDPKRSWGLATAAGRRIGGLGQFPRICQGLANAMFPMIGARLEPGSCGRPVSIIEDDRSRGDRGRTRSGSGSRFRRAGPSSLLLIRDHFVLISGGLNDLIRNMSDIMRGRTLGNARGPA